MEPLEALLDTVDWQELPPPEEPVEGRYATHRGILSIAGKELEFYVLDNGQRVFTYESVHAFFGGDEEPLG